jgi:hypothetical protein
MGLQLNRATDARIKELVEEGINSVVESENELAAIPKNQTKDIAWRSRWLASEHKGIGLMMYQQQLDRWQIVEHLTAAATHQLRRYALVSSPTEKGDRSWSQFDEALNLMIAFGTPEQRIAAARIAKEYYWKDWSGRPIPAEQSSDARCVAYLELLKNFAASGQFDAESCRQVKEFCLSNKSSRVEKLEILPRLQALEAVHLRDEAAWNAALEALVRYHRGEALRGEMQFHHDAFMCLPGMALGRLGLEHRMTCTVNSPYLPLHLLEID